MKVLLLGCNHASIINSYCIGLEAHEIAYKAISFEYNRSKYVNFSKINIVFNKNVYNRIKLLKGIWELYKAVRSSDVVHIFSSFSIPSRLNFIVNKIIYNRKHIRYFITFTGSDIRIPEIELKQNPFFKYAYENPAYEGRNFETLENSFKSQHFFALRGFNLIANPEIIPFIKPSFFNTYFLSHHPSSNYENLKCKELKQKDLSKVRIVHAPSSPVAKGTSYVIETIEYLKRKWGNKIEFRLLTELSNEEFQEYLKETDIFIDQLIWGWYGVASQQALEAGKVVIAYLDQERLKLVNGCPIVNANIDNLAIILDELIANKHKRSEIEAEAKPYYEKYHSPKKVVTSVLTFYKKIDCD